MGVWEVLLPGHVPADHRELVGALPRELRGRRGHQRLLDTIPVRISVSGTRGKSGLTLFLDRVLRQRGLRVYAKTTGTTPESHLDGVAHPIDRPDRSRALLEENIWELRRYARPDLDAIVLENQGISEYTMRMFNRDVADATHLLVPNVRRDHTDTMGSTLEALARAFGRSTSDGSLVIGGERDEHLARVLQAEVEGAGGLYVDAAPDRSRPHPPGYESVTVADALLRDLHGHGLGEHRMLAFRSALEEQFQWRPSALDGVKWFDGAAINDVDSTAAILAHLLRSEPLPVTMVATLRSDRRSRTATFVPFLDRLLREDVIERVHVAGHARGLVGRRLQEHGDRVVVVDAEEDETGEPVDVLVERLQRECRGGAVMTVANAVPPFPRAVRERLEV